jgi:hypothetical protein
MKRSLGSEKESLRAIKVSRLLIRASHGPIKASHALLKAGRGPIKASRELVRTGHGRIKAGHAFIKAGHGFVTSSHGLVKASDASIKASRGLVKASDASIKASRGLVKARDASIKASRGLIKASKASIKASRLMIKACHGLIKAGHGLIKARHGLLKAGHAEDEAGRAGRCSRCARRSAGSSFGDVRDALAHAGCAYTWGGRGDEEEGGDARKDCDARGGRRVSAVVRGARSDAGGGEDCGSRVSSTRAEVVRRTLGPADRARGLGRLVHVAPRGFRAASPRPARHRPRRARLRQAALRQSRGQPVTVTAGGGAASTRPTGALPSRSRRSSTHGYARRRAARSGGAFAPRMRGSSSAASTPHFRRIEVLGTPPRAQRPAA